ncbi:OB-fold domain-containing protein [Nonomuraea sp. NPDC046570]|uniref:Zn-ribbon domain-containing OB-fold protein n=1 Tax=Nonomuraea sp. NPDC046570 TaxID=3155255 RepID=UPI00340B0542
MRAPHDIYAERLAEGVIAYQTCAGCAGAVFPPRLLCPLCGSDRLDWAASEGHGTVYSATVIPRRDGEPYNVALIDLDEGFRMMSTVLGVFGGEPEIGLRVRGTVVEQRVVFHA